ncbi:hypothetical protein DN523_14320 [Burkholderia multivorans]|uniref:hypothetical protein n=1 Tax=Burkholderia multivorans TaxID=87883 RepID=UPI0009B5E978|nr:hypothetical protein [Burkholderia multivorans]MBJ9657926.1 hypothetical protein [Burkholderia multivorans]MBR8046508.1 hypothetical protein [Burkholderia multivorans]MBR8122311.1 hypothetical protein [Burkholderia multivorans]MBU9162445.1 hypothetical protein [Burkholderia multivorans]MBU9391009.1 hypothetical protein [Burkholderia multivorans]
MRKRSSVRRRPLTKAQLLPLPADHVRFLSLKHHLALALLCDGSGDVESIATLSNILALAFYLRSDGGAELYRSADSALSQCIARAELGGGWTLTDPERTALEALLLVHDEQLAAVPVHRYLEALEKVQHIGTPSFGLPIESD